MNSFKENKKMARSIKIQHNSKKKEKENKDNSKNSVLSAEDKKRRRAELLKSKETGVKAVAPAPKQAEPQNKTIIVEKEVTNPNTGKVTKEIDTVEAPMTDLEKKIAARNKKFHETASKVKGKDKDNERVA
jgi:hypothetical protein